jgi:hypothetical protein
LCSATVHWHRLLRGFRLAPANDLAHDRPVDIDLHIFKINVLPFEPSQFAAPQPGRHVQEKQYALPQLKFSDKACISATSRMSGTFSRLEL